MVPVVETLGISVFNCRVAQPKQAKLLNSLFSVHSVQTTSQRFQTPLVIRVLSKCPIYEGSRRSMGCGSGSLQQDSCHQQASTSKLTSDVLPPGIKVCQTCHHSGEEAARSNCSKCHQYYDWNKEEYVEPKLTAAVGAP